MTKPMKPQPAPDGQMSHAQPAAAVLAAELGRSLQLSRASALALTRLQLAIRSSDRQAALAALDRLHALDAEMERLVDHLPAPVPGDPERPQWEAMARHLGDQKLALSFEKLAVASGISGPDLIGAPAPPPDEPAQPPARLSADDGDPPPLSDWPRLPACEPSVWQSVPAWLLGLTATLVALAALALAVIAMTWA